VKSEEQIEGVSNNVSMGAKKEWEQVRNSGREANRVIRCGKIVAPFTDMYSK